MTPEIQQYIETEILPHAGLVETDQPRYITILSFADWLRANMRVEMPIAVDNLQNYLLLPNDELIVKRRNIFLSHEDFHSLDLPIQGLELQGNLHKVLLTVLILPSSLVEDCEFWFLTDDEHSILTAVKG